MALVLMAVAMSEVALEDGVSSDLADEEEVDLEEEEDEDKETCLDELKL